VKKREQVGAVGIAAGGALAGAGVGKLAGVPLGRVKIMRHQVRSVKRRGKVPGRSRGRIVIPHHEAMKSIVTKRMDSLQDTWFRRHYAPRKIAGKSWKPFRRWVESTWLGKHPTLRVREQVLERLARSHPVRRIGGRATAAGAAIGAAAGLYAAKRLQKRG
jgi:hypothetical protein